MKYYPPTFRETVTLLNRRDGKDSPDHRDAWKKTVLRRCVWTQKQDRTTSTLLTNATEVKLSAAYLVRVPLAPGYRPYNAWREDMEGYTFSTGDYVIRGEIPDDVTSETVTALVDQYRPEAFEVQVVKDNTTAGFLSHYRLEGK